MDFMEIFVFTPYRMFFTKPIVYDKTNDEIVFQAACYADAQLAPVGVIHVRLQQPRSCVFRHAVNMTFVVQYMKNTFGYVVHRHWAFQNKVCYYEDQPEVSK